MNKHLSEFIFKGEVIPIHVRRYDAQISRLLTVQDYTEDDVFSGSVRYKDFIKARDRKIKALNDCLSTMVAKESLLQFHNLGTEFSFTNEKIEIHKSQPKQNLNALNLEEKIELYHLIQKAKKQQIFFAPITYNNYQQRAHVIEDAEVIEESPNVNKIKQIEAPANEFTLKLVDPIQQLQKAFERVAAKKFDEMKRNE